MQSVHTTTPTTPSKIRVLWHKPTASGRRTGWARVIQGVRDDVRGVKAFDGHYLRDGVEHDLDVGTLVLEVRPVGSAKNGWEVAHLLRVTADGLETITEDYDWRAQFLSLRDRARDELRAAPERAPAQDGAGLHHDPDEPWREPSWDASDLAASRVSGRACGPSGDHAPCLEADDYPPIDVPAWDDPPFAPGDPEPSEVDMGMLDPPARPGPARAAVEPEADPLDRDAAERDDDAPFVAAAGELAVRFSAELALQRDLAPTALRAFLAYLTDGALTAAGRRRVIDRLDVRASRLSKAVEHVTAALTAASGEPDHPGELALRAAQIALLDDCNATERVLTALREVA